MVADPKKGSPKKYKTQPNAQNSFLKGFLLVTLLATFTVLLLGGYWIFKDQAPRPEKITSQNGQVLFDKAHLMGGQAVFQKYGLMDYGTVLGDGSYLGPDYTAESLKIVTDTMHDYYAKKDYNKDNYASLTKEQQVAVKEKVIAEMKQNRYDASTQTLPLTDAQVAGLQKVRDYYHKIFTEGDGHGLYPGLIKEDNTTAYIASGDQITQISDFFFWTAWLSSAYRPGDNITYTNNWPYFEDAGNTMSYSAMLWSGVSATLLILLMGVILYVHQRYKFDMEEAYEHGKFPQIRLESLPVTLSQVKSGKYFTVVSLLFLVQCMFGALLAHYYTEPTSFFGIKWIAELIPFSIAKTYHLQLAIFWIATAWLGMGIYIAPIVGGKEPKKQGLLVDILFWALVVLVVGSMIGEYAGINDKLGNAWFWLGHQGWEYLELGRVWQIVLAVGMVIWLFIVFRGIRSGLKREKDKGGLIHLLFYSSITVPLFYLFAFFMMPSSSFTMADYWRWWIIHLWVEGVFEVFAVCVIGFLMVQMGLTTKKSTVRALYFQFILLMGSGVIGIGHHYYYQGSSEAWIGLGATFSALEVVPLSLLILEAYSQYKMMKDGGVNFPYKAPFWFLISTAIWNLVGAGVLGFLVNLPAVSYFEHGTTLTTAHAHGSMMGVYGMFAVAVLLFTLRNIVKPEAWNDKLLKISCWGLNIGLLGMIVVTLLPVGFMQLKVGFEQGYWASRAFEFYQTPLVNELLWIRMLPDTIFLVFGVMPLAWFSVKALFNLRKPTAKEEEKLNVPDLAE
jgi:nitric oxide reductase subunit B